MFAPAVFAAELISSNVVEHFPAGGLASLASAAIVASGYAATAALLRRIPLLTRRQIRVRTVATFLATAAAGAFAVAVADVNAIVALGGLPPNLRGAAVWHSFIGDLTGIIGLLPALLTWRSAWERWSEITLSAKVIDLGVFFAGLGAALLLVFGNAHEKELQLFYLMLPPVIWIAVRHGLAWSAAAILVDQLALVGTIAWMGFSSNDFLSCQLLSIVISATGLILGAVVTQRHDAEHLLRRQQAELARHARLTTVGAFGAGSSTRSVSLWRRRRLSLIRASGFWRKSRLTPSYCARRWRMSNRKPVAPGRSSSAFDISSIVANCIGLQSISARSCADW